MFTSTLDAQRKFDGKVMRITWISLGVIALAMVAAILLGY